MRRDKLEKSYYLLKQKTSVLEVVSRALTSDYFDLDKLLDFIMELALKTVKAEAGSLLLVEGKDNLVFKIAKGERGDEIKRYVLKVGEGIAGWVAKEGKAEIVHNVSKDTRWKKEISEDIKFHTKSILCVPISHRQKIIGVIELINKKGRKKFSKEDKDLLSVLASQSAIAIENSYLFQEAQNKIRGLTILSEVSTIITSSLNLRKVLKNIMDMATRLMKAEASALMLIDKETNELIFEVAEGEKEEEVKSIRLKVGEGIAGYVAKEGIPLLIEDAYSDSRFNPEVDKLTGFKTQSILCVPMKVRDKIVGVVEVLNRKDKKPFDKYDEELFSSLAAQAAIAVENANLYKDLKELFFGAVRALASTIDAKSPYTHGHSERVSIYSLQVAEEMGLPEEEKEIIRISGLLHDVGKIGVDEAIINKPGKLTDEEYEIIKKHPSIGAEIIKPISALSSIIPGVKYHQERYDGSGYPEGLKGERIPLVARILAICDSFDAMNSKRPYRDKLPDEFIMQEIEKNKGAQFDPDVAEVFLRIYKKGIIEGI